MAAMASGKLNYDYLQILSKTLPTFSLPLRRHFPANEARANENSN
jgi:hypothetical protein